MGCGFSNSVDTKLSASSSTTSDSPDHYNDNEKQAGQNMGSGHSKRKKSKSNNGDAHHVIKAIDEEKKTAGLSSNNSSSSNHHHSNNKKSNNAQDKNGATPSNDLTPPLQIHNDVSASQVNFFKMLDEKIENGVEFDEEEEERERKLELQRCVVEWDTLLGRSHENDTIHIEKKSPPSDKNANNGPSGGHRKHKDKKVSSSPPTSSDTNGKSADSMRTMFSNSVSLPAGTFKEDNVASSRRAKLKSSSSSAGSSGSAGSGGRPVSAVGRRTASVPNDEQHV